MILTGDKGFYKSLFLLALPIALQNLLTYSLGLCDSIMVGRLGGGAVAGMYMGNQVQMLLQVICTGIEGTVLVLATQFRGRGKHGAVREIAGIGVKLAFALGAVSFGVCFFMPEDIVSLFAKSETIVGVGSDFLRVSSVSFIPFCISQALFASMRSVSMPKVCLYTSLVTFSVNLIFNYVFIFGKFGAPALGVAGAGYATVIARFCELVLILGYVLFFDKKLGLSVGDILRIRCRLFPTFFKSGIPVILGQVIWGINMLFSSFIIGNFGSDNVVSALGIANTLYSLVYVCMYGISGAVGIIIGKNIGEGKYQLIREYSRTAQIIFLAVGVLSGVAMLLLRNPFVSLYNISTEAEVEAKRFILILSILIVGTAYQSATLSGIIKSGGDTSFVFKTDAFFVFLVVIPLALAAVRLKLPAYILFFALKSDQILKCPVAFIKVNRYRWMKNLAKDKVL